MLWGCVVGCRVARVSSHQRATSVGRGVKSMPATNVSHFLQLRWKKSEIALSHGEVKFGETGGLGLLCSN